MANFKFHFYQDGKLIRKLAFVGSQQIVTTIGKIDKDVCFSTDGVSKMHAQLIVDANSLSIIDFSTNGIFINNNRIPKGQKFPIGINDEIAFTKSKSAILKIIDVNTAKPLDQKFNSVMDLDSLGNCLANKDEVTIGRALDCDVVLDHSSVSRKHATVKRIDTGKFLITDLGSLNGTFVNNKRVHIAEVTTADKIYIGRFQLSLEGAVRNLSNESAVRALNICKRYRNGFLALNETSFDIPSGGLIAIMGPSGCGKSTLLKVLNGDSPATTGEVYINGLELIHNYGYLKTQIGYVPQDDIVHQQLTVEQSLFYAAQLRLEGVNKDQIDLKINQLLTELNISDLREQLVSAISGGQRKRVSIAVELLSDPAVLFLDEPTSPLDPQTIEEFMGILRNLSTKGTTVILVTHKPDDLAHMDSVMFLAEGGHMVYFGGSKKYKDYFGVLNPVDVYANISGGGAKFWIDKASKPSASLQISENSDRKKNDSVNPARQFYWLMSRYLKIKTNDRASSLIMILQAPIIALLLCVIFDEIRGAVPFLMAISAIWFGVNNAAREIVSESPIYKRERMFNVLIIPYVFSKVTVLGLFAIIQSILFNALIWLWYSGTTQYIGWADPINSAIWMCYLTVVSSIFGLYISAVSNNTEKVMSIVPIAVIPQIMLAGVITKIPNFFVEFISYFTFSRWGTEGFNHIQRNVVEPMPKIQTFENNPGEVYIVNKDTLVDACERLNYNFHSSYQTNFGNMSGTMKMDILFVTLLGLVSFVGIVNALRKKDSFKS
jgi:ABC-type multidrug transport system ATPase subunit/pSer/pThr/pTyr-binding forkhead associated (FHA) protein